MAAQTEIKHIYPLTPTQEGMLFHALLDPASPAYFVQSSYRLQGDFSPLLAEQTLNELFVRHDILRTSIVHQGLKRPFQVVLRERKVVFQYKDLRTLETREAQRACLAEYKQQDVARGFDLREDVLMRVSLLQLAGQEYEFVWSYHHILMDGWCMSTLIQEFSHIYQCFQTRRAHGLPPVPAYHTYVKWLEKQDKAVASAYWSEYLDGYQKRAVVPGASTSPARDGYSSGQVRLELDEALTAKLALLAASYRLTLSVVMQTLWGVLLSRYNDTQDVVFGAVVAGRPPEVPGIDSMIGLFINTIPLRVHYGDATTFVELAAQMQQDMVNGSPFHYYPLADIQSGSALKQNLITHLFVTGNQPLGFTPDADGGNRQPVVIREVEGVERTNYDFNVHLTLGASIRITFDFNGSIYRKDRVEKMAAHFEHLIGQVTDQEQVRVEDLKLLTRPEEEALHAMSHIPLQYPGHQPLYEQFVRMARETPHATALRGQGLSISYGELLRKSSLMASRLRRDYAVRRGQPVAVLMERSEAVIVSLLAIWQAGAVYLPLEVSHPVHRQKIMLDQNGVETILTVSGYELRARSLGRRVICVDYELEKPDSEHLTAALPGELPAGAGLQDVAYIIYTSGTTGIPKGIPIRHDSIANRIRYHLDYMAIRNDDNVLQLASLGFDASLVEIGMGLLGGGGITIAGTEAKTNFHLLLDLLETHRVTVAIFTPALLKAFHRHELPTIRKIISTGEAANLEESLYYARSKKIYNGYGPAETCVGASFYLVDGEQTEAYRQQGFIPIGRPFANTGIYLLDSKNRLVPEGVSGEIAVSGIGLSPGYVGDEAATREKFIPNLFGTGEREERLYKTGDLGRWNERGELEYLGRKDEQVQIRGIRVEPGEIEAVLEMHPLVAKAAVVPVQSAPGQHYLLACLVARPGTSGNGLQFEGVQAYLREHLPEHMIPAQVEVLPALPMLPSGKVDRKAVMETGRERPVTKSVYRAPGNELEEHLVRIWEEVLDREPIGVADNFFELGGHSLKATRLISRLYKELNQKIELKTLFTHPTISALARTIEAQEEAHYEAIPRVAPQADYPLSHQQWRLWVLHQLAPQETAYQVRGIYQLRGAIDQQALRAAFTQLVERHESLRTRFVERKGAPRQLILPAEESGFALQYVDCSSWLDYSALPEGPAGDQWLEQLLGPQGRPLLALSPFALESQSLLRVKVLRLAAGHHLLEIVLHHIVADGWSMQVLFKEVILAYNAAKRKQSLALAPLPVHYKDYAVWQAGRQLQQQSRAYWLGQLAQPLPVLELSTDFARPAYKTYQGEVCQHPLGKELTGQLEGLCRQQGVSLFMLLLGAVKVLLYRYSGQPDLVVGMHLAGREHPELEGQIGFYVNTVALRSRLQGQESFLQLLARLKEQTLQAFHHQHYPAEQLVEELNLATDLSRSPLFDVLINMNDTRQVDRLGGSMDDVVINHFAAKTVYSRFDLSFHFYQSDNGVLLDLEYSTDLFRRERMERLTGHLEQLLVSVLNDPGQPVNRLEYLTRGEGVQLLEAFNPAEVRDSETVTLVDLFEAQVAKTPEALAVLWEDERLTYRQLNEQANQLAHYLRERHGVQPNDRVGLLVERSARMIVYVWGIWKSGAAYVPVDPDHVSDRAGNVLLDSKVKLCVMESHLLSMIGDADLPALHLPDQLGEVRQFSTRNPANLAKPATLAYVIYTSGSTGRPKGVMVEHGSVVNIALAWKEAYRLAQFEVRLLQLASVAFDVFCGDICRAHFSGGSLIVVPSRLKGDNAGLYQLLNRHRATILESTPALLVPFMDYVYEAGLDVSYLKLLILGSDTCRSEEFRRLVVRFGEQMRIVNSYGTTETTIDSSFYEEVPEKLSPSGGVPIGRPLRNTQYYILDGDKNLLPLGVTGELYIGGKGLSRGYLNEETLTGEKFVEHPFKPGQRLYKTGDLGRWLPDGNLELLGRKDNQVKLRGYRIELGEIESTILQHEWVNQATAVLRGQGQEAYLVAYVQAGNIQPAAAAGLFTMQLRRFLQERLPAYMLPATLVEVEQWPLTSNGKLDRKALPDPYLSLQQTYVAPRGELEAKLVGVWEEVLGREPIGVEDNFFELGGHSLKATRLISRLCEALAQKIELRTLFAHPTVAALARVVAAAVEASTPVPPVAPGTGPAMLHQQLQLESELAYVRQQLSKISDETVAPNPQSGILQLQQDRLRKWLAWLPDHFYQVPITPIEEQEDYETSIALKHFWIGFRQEKTHVPFNMVLTFFLDEFDEDPFRMACAEMIRRHEILRTVAVFSGHPGTVRQKVLPVLDVDAVITILDVSQESDRDNMVEQYFAAAREHIFAYEQGPLFYFVVFKYDTHRYTVLFNVSHAIFDDYSGEIFEKEFRLIYRACSQRKSHPLADLTVQYKDFSAWEAAFLQTDLATGFAQYWYSQSPDRYPSQNLSTYFSNRPLTDSSYRDSLKRRIKPYLRSTDDATIGAFYGVVEKAERTRAHYYRFAIGGETFNRLNAMCRERSISPYHVLVAALNVLIYKTTGIRDIVVGTHTAIRDREEVQKLLGFFINTVLVRNCVAEKKTFNNLITDVIISTTLASFYKNYKMAKVLDDLDIPFNAVNTLFLNMLPLHSQARLTDFSKRHYANEVFGFYDMDVTVGQYPNGLEFWCAYDLTIYTQADITTLFDNFENILVDCLRHPHVALEAIDAIEVTQSAKASYSESV